jgi:hypothetical protein
VYAPTPEEIVLFVREYTTREEKEHLLITECCERRYGVFSFVDGMWSGINCFGTIRAIPHRTADAPTYPQYTCEKK